LQTKEMRDILNITMNKSCKIAFIVGFMLVGAVSVNAQDLLVSCQSTDGNGAVYNIASAHATPTALYSGMGNPTGLAYDSSGNLFVGSIGVNRYLTSGQGAIYQITPGGNKSTYASGLDGPMGLVFGSGGYLYVSSGCGNDNLYKFTAPSTKTVLDNNHNSGQLAFNSQGVLFKANPSNGSVSKGIPGSSLTDYGNGGVAGNAMGVAIDASDNLFVSDANGGSIYEFPGGVISSANKTIFATGLNQPYGLLFDGSGDLFVAEFGNGAIAEFLNTGGSLSSTATTYETGLTSPTFMTVAVPVPEPSVFTLAGLGIVGLLALRRRK